eukprot:g16831.t2
MSQTDREALITLYNATDGPNWSYSHNWCTDAALADWQGVVVDDQDRVVELRLVLKNLRGSIPPELGNLAALKVLHLEYNKLNGSIPPELGNLAALIYLNLQENQLDGSIPPELGNLAALETLYLRNNQLNGSIPPELGNLAALNYLDLRNNQLNGSIPPELGQLAALLALFLRNNQLNGSIPPELGNLAALTYLDLRNNQLNGSIPPELGDLAALKTLNLGNNQLNGAPPRTLEGPKLTRWLEKTKRFTTKRPWAMSAVDFLVALWHFLVPVFDDVTDVILLIATFEDRGGLWWACFGAFVLADIERLLMLLVALCLVLCWIPFALAALELLTELQYYAAEAEADMTTGGEETRGTEGADSGSRELANHAPPV